MTRFEVYEEFDFTEKVGNRLLENNLKGDNNMFDLSWGNVKSALVTALVTALLGMAGYVIGLNDVFKIDFHSLVNIGSLSALTAIISLLKNFLTSERGEFLGVVDTKA